MTTNDLEREIAKIQTAQRTTQLAYDQIRELASDNIDALDGLNAALVALGEMLETGYAALDHAQSVNA